MNLSNASFKNILPTPDMELHNTSSDNCRHSAQRLLAITLICCQFFPRPGFAQASNNSMSQPELGSRSVKTIVQQGLVFKDLNKNNKVDVYEDWRLTPAQRSIDLIKQMTVEEKAGMMLIADMRMFNERSMFERGGGEQKAITTDFSEQDAVVNRNQFTGDSLPYPVMSAVGTTNGVIKNKLRHFIWRTTAAPADSMAKWANRVQALAESDRLGIPVIFASNPRNHISGGGIGATGAATRGFSKWPSEIGLAAMRDTAMVRRFADIARQEWLATGIRKGYMYMGDLATEPRWQRIEGSLGEDPVLAAACISALVSGFQGPVLNGQSVALTTKHFPGGGATEKGFDPHYSYGKNEVFPGKRFEANLLPFKAAIKAGTSSIMPYYSIPKGTKYEEIAYAYNKGVLNDLLRKELGFKGIINSDTGPIESMPWGVEALNIQQRYYKALAAGVNLFSGNADPSQLIALIKNRPEVMKYVDESVKLLLNELFTLGLFENAYVNEGEAGSVVGKPEFVNAGKEAQRKSIVLLRNEQQNLPITNNTKIYFEDYYKNYRQPAPGAGTIYNQPFANLTFVPTPEEADLILLWLKPSMRPLFPADDSPLSVNLSACAVDVKYVNELTKKKPTILVINYSNPFVIDEIYNDQTKNRFVAVLATFGAQPDALLDIITGKFKPTAKMPFTTPVSAKAVENNKEDVAGYEEGEGYGLFRFGEGLEYKL